MTAECRFEEAAGCLDQCSPATFQPTQLFPLFPSYTAPWAREVPSHQRYWGLHAPLPSLEELISRHLGSGSSSGQRRQLDGSSQQHSPSAGAAGSSRSSLFGLETSSAGAESPAATSSPTAAPRQQLGAAAASTDQRAPQSDSLQPPGSAEQQQQREPQDARRQLQRRAWEALAQYLFRVSLRRVPRFLCCGSGTCLLLEPPPTSPTPVQVRMLEGVACLPGIDTLLLLLLADLGDARQVAAFAAVPNEVDVMAVELRLQVCGCRAGRAVCRALRWVPACHSCDWWAVG